MYTIYIRFTCGIGFFCTNVPIIVISARSEDVDKIEALDAGADDYITKPFSVDELLARIRVTQRRLALIQSGEEQEQAVFVNGELKIDYTAGSTYLKDKELHLTPIEYKLLCLLSFHDQAVQKKLDLLIEKREKETTTEDGEV